MRIQSAEFVLSNTRMGKLPVPQLPEYAFIGRSNVGKSSLINMLTDKKGLAKTSQTPGKTQLINHFIINGNWYLVDLPGYGYARTSRSNRSTWLGFIRTYIQKRENLQCVFVLIDSKLEPQKIDLEFCAWLGERSVPFALVFTKADKQSAVKTDQHVAAFKKELLKTFEELPASFITSAETRTGRNDVLGYITQVNTHFEVPAYNTEFYASAQA